MAVIVTGPQLTPRIEGPVWVIHQSDELLNSMDAWNKGTHGKSGLIDKVKASTLTEEQAQAELLAKMAYAQLVGLQHLQAFISPADALQMDHALHAMAFARVSCASDCTGQFGPPMLSRDPRLQETGVLVPLKRPDNCNCMLSA